MPASRPMILKAVGEIPLSNLKLYHLLSLPAKKVNVYFIVSCTGWGIIFGNRLWGLELFLENCFLFSWSIISLTEVEIPQKAKEKEMRHLCIKQKVKNMKGK